ncbi:MAG: M23 family metallopeptidase [Myxococcales bacterium]|nr:M23 family metallopeptidase [Myxococcales bacterium]
MRLRGLFAAFGLGLLGLVACGSNDDADDSSLTGGAGGTDASAATGGASGAAGAGGSAGAGGAAGSAGAAGGGPDAASAVDAAAEGGGPDAGASDSGATDAGAAPCCLTKPPGTVPTNGGWNDCPYSGSGRQHAAIDYSSKKGTPIPAGMDGVVQYVRNKNDPKCYDPVTESCSTACLSSGDFIMIKSACGDPLKPGNDFYVRYHHIDGVNAGLAVGSVVKKGDIIAFVGDSGCATGPHVHLQTATFAKGKYKVGELPVFYDCKYLVNPSTRYCKNVP